MGESRSRPEDEAKGGQKDSRWQTALDGPAGAHTRVDGCRCGSEV